MRDYHFDGTSLRLQIKSLVLEYMQSVPECSPNDKGLKQVEIFRACGLDWGDYPNAKSDWQQYWVNALLRELGNEGFIVRDVVTKRWRCIK